MVNLPLSESDADGHVNADLSLVLGYHDAHATPR